jgi:predicted RecA/RadA family phage recombinase
MAINDNQKLDFLWKKLGYGVTKTDINSIKNATNESIPSSLLIRGDKLWAEAGDIPATIPTSNTSQVELTSTETTSDLTASTNRTWKTGAADWIPPEFGSTYQVKVYIDSAGAANPQSTGTQLFAAGSGNNDEWFFDYQSGVLNFIGDNLPSGINGNKIYVVGARYIGNFGISGTSDGIVEGSNNLYYTDERVDDRVADLIVDGVGITKNYDDAGNLLDIAINFTEFDSDDIVEGAVNTFLASRSTDAIPEGSTNLYYTDARTDARIALQSGSNLDLSNKTTTDLAEGINLYFTDERVDDRVANLIQAGANVSLVYDDVAGTLTISATEDNLANNTTDDLAEGSNLYYTEARVDANIASKDTGDLAEGSNLYYTEARVQTYLTNNNYATVSTVTQQVAAQIGSLQSDLDDEIYDREQADINLQSQIDSIVTYSSSDFDTDFAGKSTTDLTEGTNLYYTDTRVRAAISATTGAAGYDSATGTFSIPANTTQVTEGSNLYYTDARTDARIALQSGSNLDLSSKDTDELSEGSTNLYYTEARVDANIATKDTGDLAEGSNLYYTDARVQTKLGSVSGHIIPDTDITYDLGSSTNKFRDLYLSGSSITLGTIELTDNGGALEVTPIGGGSTETFATETYVDTAVANLVDTAPTTLDTLNELAAALGDDPNFSTTITNLIGTKLATADFNTTADTWIGTKSTSDLTEGSNLYYTESRVDARIALQSGSNLDLSNKDTDDLSEGSTNLYYTDARVNSAFDTRLSTKSTTDLTEGTNLYYTDTRVRAAISVTGDLTYDSATGVISTQGLASSDTDDLSEGSVNLYYTDGRVQSYLTNNNYAKTSDIPPIVTQQVAAQIGSVQSDLDDEIYDREQGDLALQTQINSIVTYSGSDFDTDFANKSTTDLAEGTNLYYTDARVSSYLSTNGFATETYVDNAVSNLIDTAPTTLDTLNELAAALNDDPNFSTTITNLIGTKLATADFNTTADAWIGTKSTTDLSEGSNLYYTDARTDARIALQSGSNLDLSNKNTDDLSEGSTNLYYTDSRADARVNLQTGTNLDLSNKSTTNLAEGTNLYYTDARVDARISSAGLYTSSDFNTDFSVKSTTDLTEGTNLYYTDARVAAYIATTSLATTTYVNSQIAIVNSNLDDEIYNREQADISLQTQINAISSYTTSDFNTDFATKDTDDLSEGSTNLYYTDARVDARITAAGSVTQSDIDSAISALIDSAPGTLDTLNELAAALGDDANFSTTITNSIATKLAISDFNTTADTWLTGKSTSNISEGTNLYYTDARVDARIAASNPYTSADFDTDFSGKSTTDLAEGTNLYYTQARFDSSLSTKSTTDLAEGNNLYYTDARVDARITNAGLFDGDYNSLTNLPTLFDGQFSSLTGKPTTLAGYGITDGVSTSNVNAIVTQQVAAQTSAIQSDLDDEIYDREQADIGLQNQINGLSTYTSTDFNTDFATKSTTDLAEGANLYYTDSRVASYLSNQGITSETTTTLGIAGNILTYTDEDGNATNIDLSLYLDDTNLARLTSGSLAANGIATFTRDDASTFTVDFSQFFDDTNLSRVDNATFSNGTLTLTRDDSSTAASVNLDGRYLQNFVAQTTDDLSEGSTNLYYTDARVRDQLYSTVSVTTSSGNFYIDGEQQGIVTLQPGRTYRFDQSDASNNSHPLRFSEVSDGTHAGGGATEYTTGVTVNGTAGNSGAYVEFVVTNATPRLYYYCANHSGMGGKVSVGKEMFVERITSDTWITGPIQTTSVNVGTGGSINASTATLDFTHTLVNFSGATVGGLSNSDVGLANIADNAQGVVVNGKVAAGSLDIGTGGSINAQLATLDFTHTLVNFGGATVGGLGDTIQDEVDFHLNKNNSGGTTIISDGEILSWNATGGLQGTGDYEWIAQSGGGASVTTSSTAPTSPNDGDLWFDTDELKTYVYYNDGTSSQWVQSNPTGAIGGGSSIADTDALPEGSTNLYYTDARVQTKLGDVSGHIIPDTDVTYDLGSSTHKFRDLYLSGNSITLGGIILTEHSGALQVHTTGGGSAQPFATVSYVDTELASLVDSAPTTLDTLNELAAALGDDPNFATTITNLIGTKLATADFNTTADSWLTTKSTTNLSEGTNLYYTDTRADARVNLQTGTNLDLSSKTTTDLAEGINLYYTQARFDSAFTAKSTTDLSEGTNLYYTDARVRAHVEGQDLDLGTNKVLFSNMYATTGDLPSATSYHGMFAHVHGTGKAYYAHSGSWIELANDSQIVAQDFSWSSITGTPTTLAGYGITDGFVDADVDTHINTSTATANQVLSWNGTDYAWVAQSSGGGGGGGASVSVSDTAPSSPSVGDLWFNSANTKMYVYFNDGTSSQWIQSNPSGASTPITAADTAPSNPVENSMWFDSTDGTLYFRYNDGTSEQWVNLIGATSSGGSGGSSVTVSDSAPTSPTEGDMWFDSRYAVLLVYYGTQWVNVSGESGSSTTPSWQETTNHTASAGDKLFVDCSGGVVTVTLPASPSMGDEIRIIDATGSASTNNITVARNGNNIQGVADNLTIDTDRAAFGLVYYNSTQGWLLMER